MADKPIDTVKSNIRAGLNDPVWSGKTGMDQSINMDVEPTPPPTNQGNVMPAVPTMERGVK